MAEAHVVSALRKKRGELSAYIHDLEQKVATWRARLAHTAEPLCRTLCRRPAYWDAPAKNHLVAPT